MVIQVNQALCTGCDVCITACPVGAIQLVDQRAVIDDTLCTQCDSCIDVCPNGAITALSIPVHNAPIVALPEAKIRMIHVPAKPVGPETATPARGLAPLVGAALTFLGREVAPRLADVLIAALERRLTQPMTNASAPSSSVPFRSLKAKGRRERRQARYRRGSTGNINQRERR